MAAIGTIEQYQGPFLSPSTKLELDGKCIIGISISEDDYMRLGSTSGNKSFRFTINGQQIWMGRTYIYQTEKQIDQASGETKTIITFPDGAPASVKVEVVYCSATS